MTLAWNLTLALACTWLATVLAVRLRLRRPPAVGDTPHCARCGYVLTGNRSGRCPECGAALAGGAVQVGRVPRRWKLKIAIVAAVAGAAVAGRAWSELTRREATGELSPRAADAIVDLALDAQARPAASPISTQLLGYLMRRHDARDLSPAQTDRLYRQAFEPTLKVREVVAAGDLVPVKLEFRGNVPTGSFTSSGFKRTVTVDGRPAELLDPPPRYAGHDTDLTYVRIATPGTHTVRLRVDRQFEIITSLARMWPRTGPEYRWTCAIDVAADVRVLDRDPGDLVKRVTDRQLATAVGRSIRIFEVNGRPGRGELRLELFVLAPPADLAFDAFVRVNGVERPARSLTATRGKAALAYVVAEDVYARDVRKFDLLLRPSPTAARLTPHLVEIWGEEVVVRDLAPK